MNCRDIALYIISFLLREEDSSQPLLTPLVGYTRDPEEMLHYKVVIYPSGFFDNGVYATKSAYPSLSPKQWRGTPLLFGSPYCERLSPRSPLVIYADIVASTFFLISRYEEMLLRHQRDKHGRFLGTHSYPARVGFIHRPIVEEYGRSLLEILREEGYPAKLTQKGFAQINFTHDVDQPYEYHGFRSFCRAIIKERKSLHEAFRLSTRNILNDRYWTFPRFLEWNKEVSDHYPGKVKTILFYKTPGNNPLDRPNYSMNRGPMRLLRGIAQKYDVEEGWHIPLSCSEHPKKMMQAQRGLKKALEKTITKSRYHYLSTGEFENTQFLLRSGIRDDYSMGYADVAGFRLGTCRPVRMILPNSGEITRLKMHPLTAMEVSLMRPDYMNLKPNQALQYLKSLIDEVATHHGELNLLFHNEWLSRDVAPEYLRLYRDSLRYILHYDSSDECIVEEYKGEHVFE